MKKIFRPVAMLFATAAIASTFASCSKDNDGIDLSTSEGDTYLQKVLEANVNNTINPTYESMSANASKLYESIKALHESVKTQTAIQAQVDEVCSLWKKTRADYEMSEAFLLGAASDYDVDPHIDTWPLDLKALHSALNSPSIIERLDGEDGPTVANGDLGQNLLGFHGIEFIFFRDGKNREVAELNGKDTYNKDGLDFTSFTGDYELIFAEAVAGDLRNSIYRLEVCWNENAPQEHVDVLEELEWATTMPSSDWTYGKNMMSAGQVGSVYRSIKGAVSAVLIGDGGASGIADEVGKTKLGNPYSGEDDNYIESPYSHNSLTDFWDNIQSINNVWNGGFKEDNRSEYSFANYFKKYNPELGTKVQNAINNVQTKLEACPTPFVTNYHNDQVKAAIDACEELVTVLSEADDFIQHNND